MTQWTNFFARKRSYRKGVVSKQVMTRLHLLMDMRSMPSRMGGQRIKATTATCSSKSSKAKNEKHGHTPRKLAQKYTDHKFVSCRIGKSQ
jgi:hypothetical protein